MCRMIEFYKIMQLYGIRLGRKITNVISDILCDFFFLLSPLGFSALVYYFNKHVAGWIQVGINM